MVDPDAGTPVSGRDVIEDVLNSGVESLSTEKAATDSAPASYHVHTDGTTVWATPQQNPSDPEMAQVQDTDVGPLLDEIIKNQLPPQGTFKEARGKIYLKAGAYPGKLSNGLKDGLTVPIQCVIEGELASHDEPGSSRAAIPSTKPPVQLKTDNIGLRNPNVDTDLCIYPRVRNIQLIGPGAATSSTGIDGTNSNKWDWIILDNVVIQQFLDAADLSNGGGQLFIRDCQWLFFNGSIFFKGWDRGRVSDSVFVMKDGAQFTFSKMHIMDSGLHCHGNSKAGVRVFGAGRSTFDNVRLEKLGSQGGDGIAVDPRGSGSTVSINGLNISHENNQNQFANPVRFDSGSGHSISHVKDKTNNDRTVTIIGADDVRVEDIPAGTLFYSSGLRAIHEGRYVEPPTIDLAGSATASIAPKANPLSRFDIRLDGDSATASGTATLQQITNINEYGTRVVLIHTGDDTITLQDATNSGVAADGLVNPGGTNDTLDANGEVAVYDYDGAHWRQTALNVA